MLVINLPGVFKNIIPMESPAYDRMAEILIVGSSHQPDLRFRKAFVNIDAVVRVIVYEQKLFVVFQQILNHVCFGLRRMSVILDESCAMS